MKFLLPSHRWSPRHNRGIPGPRCQQAGNLLWLFALALKPAAMGNTMMVY